MEQQTKTTMSSLPFIPKDFSSLRKLENNQFALKVAVAGGAGSSSLFTGKSSFIQNENQSFQIQIRFVRLKLLF